MSRWLRADPVNLRVERDQLVLDPLAAATLSHDSAAELVATLNAHFAADGVRFSTLGSRRWYVETDRAPDVLLPTLSAAAGRNVDEMRAQGPDAMAWQRIGNEVQMLLHDHAVNALRESHGEAAINSVWFWGAGVLPARIEWPFVQTWSNDPIARGMALLARAPQHRHAAQAPKSAAHFFERVQNADGSGRHLIVLDTLRTAVREQSVAAWRSMLMACEQSWFAPLLEALQRDRIGMLTLHAPSSHCSLSTEAIRGDLVKFWRRARPLAAYAELRP